MASGFANVDVLALYVIDATHPTKNTPRVWIVVVDVRADFNAVAWRESHSLSQRMPVPNLAQLHQFNANERCFWIPRHDFLLTIQ